MTAPSVPALPRHDPEYLSAGRRGSWANCSCGWRSITYTTVTGACVAFAEHLTSTNPADGPDPSHKSGETA